MLATTKQRATAAGAKAVRPVIAEIAHLSMRAVADELDRRGIRAANGGRWHAMQVLRARHCLGL
jgi:hypothetical protein